jgi:hypothetical protein
VLRFWFFVTKEYSSIQEQDAEMNQLLMVLQLFYFILLESLTFNINYKKFWRLLNDEDYYQNISQFLYIVEEYFLLGFIPIKDLQNMLSLVENKYTSAVNIDIVEFKVELKQACLNLVATLLLVVLNNQATEALVLFQVRNFIENIQ